MGRPRRSALAPILRSEAQGQILSAVYLQPESLHVRALADRTQLPYSVVQREVDRLEEGRLVTSTRFATTRLVRANEQHPLYPELRVLLLKAYGPQHVVSELLSKESGVKEAHLFGSWADRYHGNWGAEWGDIDVAAVGALTPARVAELEAEAEDLIGWPVHIEVIAPSRWAAASDPFIRTVRSRPIVEVEVSEG